MVPNPLNQDECDDSSGRDVTKFLFETEPGTEVSTETSHQGENGTTSVIYDRQHVLNLSNVKMDQHQSSDAGYCCNVSQKNCRRRKKLSPTHSPETLKETSFQRRRRQKQQSSLGNLFKNEGQELCFRFGTSYKEFALPLGVEPTSSAQQYYPARAQENQIQKQLE